MFFYTDYNPATDTRTAARQPPRVILAWPASKMSLSRGVT